MSDAPLTHGTNGNASESGTTRCGLAYTPECDLPVYGATFDRAAVLRLYATTYKDMTSLPPLCPTCFPVAAPRYYHRDGSSCADDNCGRAHVGGVGAMAGEGHADLRGLAEALFRAHGYRNTHRNNPPIESADFDMCFNHLGAAVAVADIAFAEIDRLRAENEGLRAKVDAAAKRWTWSPAGTAWHLFFHAPGGLSGVMLASILTRGDGMLIPFVAGQKRTAADDTIAALTTIRALLGADVPTLPTDRSDR